MTGANFQDRYELLAWAEREKQRLLVQGWTLAEHRVSARAYDNSTSHSPR